MSLTASATQIAIQRASLEDRLQYMHDNVNSIIDKINHTDNCILGIKNSPRISLDYVMSSFNNEDLITSDLLLSYEKEMNHIKQQYVEVCHHLKLPRVKASHAMWHDDRASVGSRSMDIDLNLGPLCNGDLGYLADLIRPAAASSALLRGYSFPALSVALDSLLGPSLRVRVVTNRQAASLLLSYCEEHKVDLRIWPIESISIPPLDSNFKSIVCSTSSRYHVVDPRILVQLTPPVAINNSNNNDENIIKKLEICLEKAFGSWVIALDENEIEELLCIKGVQGCVTLNGYKHTPGSLRIGSISTMKPTVEHLHEYHQLRDKLIRVRNSYQLLQDKFQRQEELHNLSINNNKLKETLIDRQQEVANINDRLNNCKIDQWNKENELNMSRNRLNGIEEMRRTLSNDIKVLESSKNSDDFRRHYIIQHDNSLAMLKRKRDELESNIADIEINLQNMINKEKYLNELINNKSILLELNNNMNKLNISITDYNKELLKLENDMNNYQLEMQFNENKLLLLSHEREALESIVNLNYEQVNNIKSKTMKFQGNAALLNKISSIDAKFISNRIEDENNNDEANVIEYIDNTLIPLILDHAKSLYNKYETENNSSSKTVLLPFQQESKEEYRLEAIRLKAKVKLLVDKEQVLKSSIDDSGKNSKYVADIADKRLRDELMEKNTSLETLKSKLNQVLLYSFNLIQSHVIIYIYII